MQFLHKTDFWLAAATAPVFWLGYYWWYQPPLQPAIFFLQPQLYLLPIVIYPILEEFVFRGLIQDTLQNRFQQRRVTRSISWANLITSLLFVAAHFFYQPILWALAVLLPSLVFGYFKDRYQQLHAPILLHIFYNGGFFILFGLN